MRLRWLVLLLMMAVGVLQADDAAEMMAKAARVGDVKTIESLLSSGVSPDLPDASGHPPIYHAAAFDQTKAVELLLAHHADPNTPVGNHSITQQPPETPLQYAAELGDRRMTALLIERGARVNAPGPTGRTALHYAIGHLDVLQMLLHKGADANARDRDGASALDEAVWYGLLEAAAVLLADGAHLNEAEPKTGATPVNEAAYKGQTRIVEYLLRLKADLTIPDNKGYTPLENAARMGKEEAAVQLAEAAEPPEISARAMETAVRKDEGLLVAALLRHGLPASSSFLETACSAGAAKAVELLLRSGADANATSTRSSPLEVAALKGYEPIVSMLLNHGALVNHVNEESGTTALYSAAAFGKGGVVGVLLQGGANPNLCGTKQKTPLDVAVENGYSAVAAQIKASGGKKSCQAR